MECHWIDAANTEFESLSVVDGIGIWRECDLLYEIEKVTITDVVRPFAWPHGTISLLD